MTNASLSVRQMPRHQGRRGISLRFEVFAELSTSKSSRFWISVQFFGRQFGSLGPMKRAYLPLHRFQLEAQFFSSNHVAQIELSELAGEAKRRPTLIEIDDEFQTQRAPEIRQRNVSADRFQPDLSIKGKQLPIVDEAVE